MVTGYWIQVKMDNLADSSVLALLHRAKVKKWCFLPSDKMEKENKIKKKQFYLPLTSAVMNSTDFSITAKCPVNQGKSSDASVITFLK